MKNIVAHSILSILIYLLFCTPGFCLKADDVVRLKASGIDDETIKVIITEKTVETCAFTVDEILAMKKAGISNTTLQNIIKSASFMIDVGPIEYAEDIRRIRTITVQDIIELKNAGISDDVIKAVISGTRSEADENEERAWKMLEKMGIIVDER